MNIDSRTQLRFQYLRLLLLSVGTIFWLISLKRDQFLPPWMGFVFGLFWGETLVVFLLSRRFSWTKIIYLELIADFFLVNILILGTGGRESPFVFLYPLLIFVASLHLGHRRADLFILACLLAYTSVYWLQKPALPLNSQSLLPFFVSLGAMGVSGFLALRLADELAHTKRKAAETKAALFRVEELHRHIMRSLASGLIITDLSGRIISANKRAEEILARPLEGCSFHDIFPSVNFDEDQQRCELILENGERRYLGYSLFPLKNENDEIFGYGFLFQDITHIKKQEERLRRTEHLAALGTMASGLVHEIKNPLASIYGAVELLKENQLVLPGGERLIKILERESRRLDKLVSDFLLFARPTRGEIQEVSLKKLLEEIREELAIGYPGRQFSLEIDLPAKIELLVEPGRFKQVLLNLCLNALEATSEAVKLEVSFYQEDGFGVLEVKDNAGGIPEEILPHIFEPFFTTKSEGTGLGLSVVHSLVSSWGGRVEVYRQDNGTTFRLYLPEKMINFTN